MINHTIVYEYDSMKNCAMCPQATHTSQQGTGVTTMTAGVIFCSRLPYSGTAEFNFSSKLDLPSRQVRHYAIMSVLMRGEVCTTPCNCRTQENNL